MADPLWQEIRSFAGKFQTSDLRPLAPGLGWKLKPAEVRSKDTLTTSGFYSSESLERLRIEKGVPDSTSDPQSQASPLTTSPKASLNPVTFREPGQTTGSGFSGISERSLSSQKKIRKSGRRLLLFKRLYSLFIDISFITLTIVIISFALVMMTESAIPDPHRVWAWIQDQLVPLLSLQEWLAAIGLLVSVYIVFFRLLVGATLGESITGIRRERANQKI